MQTRRKNNTNKKNKTKRKKILVKTSKKSKVQKGGSFFGTTVLSSTALLIGYKYLKNRKENSEYWKTQDIEFKKTLEAAKEKREIDKL